MAAALFGFLMVASSTITLVEDGEWLLRRAPNTSSHVAVDLIDGTPKMQPAALKFDDDGISVYREKLLGAAGVAISKVAKRPSDYVFIFEVETVRRFPAFDALHDPDESDPEIGFAHSLMQFETMPLNKKDPDIKERLNQMRAAIIVSARAVVVPT